MVSETWWSEGDLWSETWWSETWWSLRGRPGGPRARPGGTEGETWWSLRGKTFGSPRGRPGGPR